MLTSPLRPGIELDELDGWSPPHERAVSTRVRVVVRQRRVVAVLGALTAVFAAAATDDPGLWVGAAVSMSLAAAYLATVARMRRLAVEREMSVAFGAGPDVAGASWVDLDRELSLALADGHTDAVLEASPPRGAVAMFVLASLLGLVLAPVVAVIRLACGDLSDLRRRGILDRLVRAQRYGRVHSRRVLTVSAMATAGVAGAGIATGASAGASPSGFTAAAPAQTSQPATAAPSTYRVRAGDNLTDVAAEYGASVSSLAVTNGIPDPNVITEGQVLTVHLPPYHVVPGDTLTSLARRFGTSVSSLASGNGIADPDRILAGGTLQVGGGTLPAAVEDEPADTPSPAAGPVPT
ncbi:MAG: LysM peptidoglycan-binding domain-containing protein, partial [Acidimicrobiales bacterium]